MDNRLTNVIEEMLDVDNDEEYAMRLAFLVVSRDKFSKEIETKYGVEYFRDRNEDQEKTRITIEF